MVFVLPFDHVPTRLAENRSGGHDVKDLASRFGIADNL
jgi:hypothetical protein